MRECPPPFSESMRDRAPPLLREYARPNPLAHGKPGCGCETWLSPLREYARPRPCVTENSETESMRDRELCESEPPPFSESMRDREYVRPRTLRERDLARMGEMFSVREFPLPIARTGDRETLENGNMLKTGKPGTRDRDYFRGYSFLFSLRFRTTQPWGTASRPNNLHEF